MRNQLRESRSKIILIGPEIYTNLLQRMVQLDVTVRMIQEKVKLHSNIFTL